MNTGIQEIEIPENGTEIQEFAFLNSLMGTKCIVNETAFYNTSYESKASILQFDNECKTIQYIYCQNDENDFHIVDSDLCASINDVTYYTIIDQKKYYQTACPQNQLYFFNEEKPYQCIEECPYNYIQNKNNKYCSNTCKYYIEDEIKYCMENDICENQYKYISQYVDREYVNTCLDSYAHYNSNQCVQDCGNKVWYKLNDNNKKCTNSTKCPFSVDSNLNKLIYNDNKQCVQQCSNLFWYQDQNDKICIKSCQQQKLKLLDVFNYYCQNLKELKDQYYAVVNINNYELYCYISDSESCQDFENITQYQVNTMTYQYQNKNECTDCNVEKYVIQDNYCVKDPIYKTLTIVVPIVVIVVIVIVIIIIMVCVNIKKKKSQRNGSQREKAIIASEDGMI